MKSGIVIAGFAGIGKTTLATKYQNVIDIESSHYKWDNTGFEDIPIEKRKGIVRKQNKNWPSNYIEKIKDTMYKYDIVLVWIHPDVLDIYDAHNIDYVLCYPAKSALPFYKQRYINRNNNDEYIERVLSNYDMRLEQFTKKNKKNIILENDETLEDYLIKNNYNLQK